MALSQEQLDKILSAGANASSDALAAGVKHKRDSQAARDAQDAQLRQLITGKQMDEQAKGAQLNRQISEAERLRGSYGADIPVNVEGVSIGAKDPLAGLKALLTKQELNKPKLTPGQEAADRAFGKEYADFQAGGGYASADKNLRSVEAAANELPELNMVQRAAGFLPKSARDVLMPEASATEDRARGAMLQSLKQIMGGQFTEKDREEVLDKIYNPRQTRQENQRRLMEEVQRLRSIAEQKGRSAQQFERTGSLVGLDTSAPTAPASLSREESAELEALRRELGK